MASFEPPADEALALKEAGNALFAKADLEPALEKWLAALVLLQQREPAAATDEVMAKILTNRALALLKLRPPRADEAVEEARLACRLAPTYLKARYRLATALVASGDAAGAAEARAAHAAALALAAVQRRVYAAPTDAEFAAIAKFGPADEGRRRAAELVERAMEECRALGDAHFSRGDFALAGPAPESDSRET
ncbi:hypothetical protein JL721_3404 [Aureococcus anophagefferens]|nr:hypothetical protein JL721_3404 [Aureococcus anophagefferens]